MSFDYGDSLANDILILDGGDIYRYSGKSFYGRGGEITIMGGSIGVGFVLSSYSKLYGYNKDGEWMWNMELVLSESDNTSIKCSIESLETSFDSGYLLACKADGGDGQRYLAEITKDGKLKRFRKGYSWEWANPIIKKTEDNKYLIVYRNHIGGKVLALKMNRDMEIKRGVVYNMRGDYISLVAATATYDGGYAIILGLPWEEPEFVDGRYMVMKCGADGRIQWSGRIINYGDEMIEPVGMIEDRDDKSLVIGGKGGYVLKLDTDNGIPVFNKSIKYELYREKEGFDVPVNLSSIIKDIRGGYILSGGNESGDKYVIKVDSEGNVVWYWSEYNDEYYDYDKDDNPNPCYWESDTFGGYETIQIEEDMFITRFYERHSSWSCNTDPHSYMVTYVLKFRDKGYYCKNRPENDISISVDKVNFGIKYGEISIDTSNFEEQLSDVEVKVNREDGKIISIICVGF
ncbi:MAG: hypothetical protein N2746_01905 [Deltaproteobacteria bacterium]|nr:hypothetical protein [Deltaproteobacteria bacterium]